MEWPEQIVQLRLDSEYCDPPEGILERTLASLHRLPQLEVLQLSSSILSISREHFISNFGANITCILRLCPHLTIILLDDDFHDAFCDEEDGPEYITRLNGLVAGVKVMQDGPRLSIRL